MSKTAITFKGRIDRSELTGLLEGIARNFMDGKVCIREDAECFSVAPAESLEFEITAMTKKGKHKLAVEIKWGSGTPLGQPEDQYFISPAMASPNARRHAADMTLFTREEKQYFNNAKNSDKRTEGSGCPQ